MNGSTFAQLDALPGLFPIPGDAAYPDLNDPNNTVITNSQLEAAGQITDVSPNATVNPDGSVNPNGTPSSISSAISYVETNIGNFATRIGVVILGFIFIAVALSMFGDKITINTVTKALK